MADPLKIELELLGLNAAMAGLQQIARAVAALSAIGAGASVAGGAATAVGAVVVALTAVSVAAVRAARDFQELRDRMNASRGETGFVQVLGDALGTDIAGLARSMRSEALSGLGAGAASKIGLPISPVDVGSALNESQFITRFVDWERAMHRLGRDEEVLAAARNLGAEQLEILRYATDDQIARLKEEGMLRGQLNTEQAAQRAIEFNLQMAELKRTFMDLAVAVTPFLIEGVRVLIAIVQQGLSFLRALGVPAGSGGGQADRISSKMDRMIDALQDNTAELRQHNGVYGGGARARGAIPAGFQGSAQAGEFLHAHAVRFGAYAIGL